MSVFAVFAKHISNLIEGNSDPYLAALAKGSEADALYYSYQVGIVSELRGGETIEH